jgi:hypothetical protein
MTVKREQLEDPEPGHDVGSVAALATFFLVLVGVLSLLAMVGGP